MTGQKAIIPIGQIEQRILLIRGQRVMLDADLAGLYGTTTTLKNREHPLSPIKKLARSNYSTQSA